VSPKLTPADFHVFSQTMRGLVGICFDDHQREGVERRLGQRLEELGITSFSSYWGRLRQDKSELDFVVEALMVKETYFFRQDYQLNAFADEVLPELSRRDGHSRRVTLWSAGCSSGEEAYTLAILLSESTDLGDYRKQVVGTDLCASNIEAARRGEYRASSFRSVPAERLSQYIDASEKPYRVRASLRRMCHFQQGNLLSEADVRQVGRVDAVFCRNVLIYMDEPTRLRVLRHLFERLLPGGFLFLGHAESLLTLDTPFEPVHLSSDLAYRRPEHGTWMAALAGKGQR
jgi:chemotaxis protein methyltransferase CheR